MQPATYAHFTLAKVRHDGWHAAPSLPAASCRIKGSGNVRSFRARGAEQFCFLFFSLELRLKDSKSVLSRPRGLKVQSRLMEESGERNK